MNNDIQVLGLFGKLVEIKHKDGAITGIISAISMGESCPILTVTTKATTAMIPYDSIISAIPMEQALSRKKLELLQKMLGMTGNMVAVSCAGTITAGLLIFLDAENARLLSAWGEQIIRIDDIDSICAAGQVVANAAKTTPSPLNAERVIRHVPIPDKRTEPIREQKEQNEQKEQKTAEPPRTVKAEPATKNALEPEQRIPVAAEQRISVTDKAPESDKTPETEKEETCCDISAKEAAETIFAEVCSEFDELDMAVYKGERDRIGELVKSAVAAGTANGSIPDYLSHFSADRIAEELWQDPCAAAGAMRIFLFRRNARSWYSKLVCKLIETGNVGRRLILSLILSGDSTSFGYMKRVEDVILISESTIFEAYITMAKKYKLSNERIDEIRKKRAELLKHICTTQPEEASKEKAQTIEEKVQVVKTINENANANKLINRFEEAVFAGDKAAANRAIDNADYMQSVGYSAEEIIRIKAELDAVDSAWWESKFFNEKLQSLYVLQGEVNMNKVTEYACNQMLERPALARTETIFLVLTIMHECRLYSEIVRSMHIYEDIIMCATDAVCAMYSDAYARTNMNDEAERIIARRRAVMHRVSSASGNGNDSTEGDAPSEEDHKQPDKVSVEENSEELVLCEKNSFPTPRSMAIYEALTKKHYMELLEQKNSIDEKTMTVSEKLCFVLTLQKYGHNDEAFLLQSTIKDTNELCTLTEKMWEEATDFYYSIGSTDKYFAQKTIAYRAQMLIRTQACLNGETLPALAYYEELTPERTEYFKALVREQGDSYSHGLLNYWCICNGVSDDILKAAAANEILINAESLDTDSEKMQVLLAVVASADSAQHSNEIIELCFSMNTLSCAALEILLAMQSDEVIKNNLQRIVRTLDICEASEKGLLAKLVPQMDILAMQVLANRSTGTCAYPDVCRSIAHGIIHSTDNFENGIGASVIQALCDAVCNDSDRELLVSLCDAVNEDIALLLYMRVYMSTDNDELRRTAIDRSVKILIDGRNIALPSLCMDGEMQEYLIHAMYCAAKMGEYSASMNEIAVILFRLLATSVKHNLEASAVLRYIKASADAKKLMPRLVGLTDKYKAITYSELMDSMLMNMEIGDIKRLCDNIKPFIIGYDVNVSERLKKDTLVCVAIAGTKEKSVAAWKILHNKHYTDTLCPTMISCMLIDELRATENYVKLITRLLEAERYDSAVYLAIHAIETESDDRMLSDICNELIRYNKNEKQNNPSLEILRLLEGFLSVRNGIDYAVKIAIITDCEYEFLKKYISLFAANETENATKLILSLQKKGQSNKAHELAVRIAEICGERRLMPVFFQPLLSISEGDQADEETERVTRLICAVRDECNANGQESVMSAYERIAQMISDEGVTVFRTLRRIYSTYQNNGKTAEKAELSLLAHFLLRRFAHLLTENAMYDDYIDNLRCVQSDYADDVSGYAMQLKKQLDVRSLAYEILVTAEPDTTALRENNKYSKCIDIINLFDECRKDMRTKLAGELMQAFALGRWDKVILMLISTDAENIISENLRSKVYFCIREVDIHSFSRDVIRLICNGECDTARLYTLAEDFSLEVPELEDWQKKVAVELALSPIDEYLFSAEVMLRRIECGKAKELEILLLLILMSDKFRLEFVANARSKNSSSNTNVIEAVYRNNGLMSFAQLAYQIMILVRIDELPTSANKSAGKFENPCPPIVTNVLTVIEQITDKIRRYAAIRHRDNVCVVHGDDTDMCLVTLAETCASVFANGFPTSRFNQVDSVKKLHTRLSIILSRLGTSFMQMGSFDAAGKIFDTISALTKLLVLYTPGADEKHRGIIHFELLEYAAACNFIGRIMTVDNVGSEGVYTVTILNSCSIVNSACFPKKLRGEFSAKLIGSFDEYSDLYSFAARSIALLTNASGNDTGTQLEALCNEIDSVFSSCDTIQQKSRLLEYVKLQIPKNPILSDIMAARTQAVSSGKDGRLLNIHNLYELSGV